MKKKYISIIFIFISNLNDHKYHIDLELKIKVTIKVEPKFFNNEFSFQVKTQLYIKFPQFVTF